jgi:hypothetical protein
LTNRNFNEQLYDRSKVTQNQNRSIKPFCKRNLRSVNVTQKTPPNLIDRCITLKDKAIDRFLWLIVKINLYIKKKKKKKKKKLNLFIFKNNIKFNNHSKNEFWNSNEYLYGFCYFFIFIFIYFFITIFLLYFDRSSL